MSKEKIKRFQKIGDDLWKEYCRITSENLKEKIKEIINLVEPWNLSPGSPCKAKIFPFEEKESCPYCKSTRIYQEMVDVGVGFIAVDSKECLNCGAKENYEYWRFHSYELQEAKKKGLDEYYSLLNDLIHDHLRTYTTKEIKLGWSKER